MIILGSSNTEFENSFAFSKLLKVCSLSNTDVVQGELEGLFYLKTMKIFCKSEMAGGRPNIFTGGK